jgi:hypothetical protein
MKNKNFLLKITYFSTRENQHIRFSNSTTQNKYIYKCFSFELNLSLIYLTIGKAIKNETTIR